MSECVFCNIDLIQSALPIETEWAGNDEMFYVFEPPKPVTPGHRLVVPYFHYDNAIQNPAITGLAFEVAARVASGHPYANLITSIGKPATQSIFHLHVHVVPRREGDGLMLPWTRSEPDE